MSFQPAAQSARVVPTGEKRSSRRSRFVLNARKQQLDAINLFTLQNELVISACLPVAIMVEEDELHTEPFMLLKPTTFQTASVSPCVSVHQCLCVQLECEEEGREGQAVSAYSSLSYPAVAHSGDLADPCISAILHSKLCCNVVPWKHASTHSLWPIKKIINPLRADSLGILPPILF